MCLTLPIHSWNLRCGAWKHKHKFYAHVKPDPSTDVSLRWRKGSLQKRSPQRKILCEGHASQNSSFYNALPAGEPDGLFASCSVYKRNNLRKKAMENQSWSLALCWTSHQSYEPSLPSCFKRAVEESDFLIRINFGEPTVSAPTSPTLSTSISFLSTIAHHQMPTKSSFSSSSEPARQILPKLTFPARSSYQMFRLHSSHNFTEALSSLRFWPHHLPMGRLPPWAAAKPEAKTPKAKDLPSLRSPSMDRMQNSSVVSGINSWERRGTWVPLICAQGRRAWRLFMKPLSSERQHAWQTIAGFIHLLKTGKLRCPETELLNSKTTKICF